MLVSVPPNTAIPPPKCDKTYNGGKKEASCYPVDASLKEGQIKLCVVGGII